MEAFAKVLADPENNLAFYIEKLALENSSSNELFERIKDCDINDLQNVSDGLVVSDD